jgi:DNA-binding CsgD family transcriptional regulator
MTPPRHAACPFTDKELELLRRLADGETRSRIAREMLVKERSLYTSVSRMLARVGASNATHLVAGALRAGWIK